MRFSLKFFLVLLFISNFAVAGIDRFRPRQGGSTEIWRITHDPSMRHWANYHNCDCWSPDGRYVCYSRSEQYNSGAGSDVFIYDLHEDEEIRIDAGSNPRWANNHLWLLYTERVPEDGPADGKGTHVMWYDLKTARHVRIAYGVNHLGETDCGDRWLYGAITSKGRRQGVRIPIKANGEAEILEGLSGIQWIGNPVYPVVFSRDDHRDAQGRDLPFAPTRYFLDLEGKNVTIGSPMIQRCHMSWAGNGEYLLHGGRPICGRRWNEPFPSNLHILSAIGCGDVSACGRSGRWACGSGNFGPLQVADLRSGDGWNYLEAALSYIHDSDRFSYCFSSALEDNDSKGSPDGTKICFVTNYDLKNGPITKIAKSVGATAGGSIPVVSTEGFPEKGALSIRNEVVGYTSKTPKSFDGITRGLYRTTPWQREGLSREKLERFRQKPTGLSKGWIVTSFDARCLPPDTRRKMTLPPRMRSRSFPDDKDSPLIWQNRTDVHVAVVRRPDPPVLRKSKSSGGFELIPGENHREIRSYELMEAGRSISDKPLRPGMLCYLSGGGVYTAVAIEWSGVRSAPSGRLEIPPGPGSGLAILLEKPEDFSWTSERWLVDGKEATANVAKKADKAIRETVHRVEGVLHREWYTRGVIARRHDLNADGKPIRRLFYEDGKLARREYHTRDGEHVSTEHFDPDGYITESILYRGGDEGGHFWYDRGTPVKFTGRISRHATPEGPGTYVKKGNAWVKTR